MDKSICELFAGVGGFRLGFEKIERNWETVWFNQWEPSKKIQQAHSCYVGHFGDSLDLNNEYTTNQNISLVDKGAIPNFNLLVGGFPCQDYSVARSLNQEKGIEGKKGVLWWDIYEILKTKEPSFCLFENVDRLLKSPSKQRGRDFAIMLACLNKLGYLVEWRVVNAANYGAPQKRKRVFIYAAKIETNYVQNRLDDINNNNNIENSFFSITFPVSEYERYKTTAIGDDIIETSDQFSFNFENSGYMINGNIHTYKAIDVIEKTVTLGEILEKNVDSRYNIVGERLEKFEYLKGSKKIERVASTGHKYFYSEGPVAFPDKLDAPGRTMLTSESSVNRSTHVILDPQSNNMRTITPIEAERLQGFNDDWTNGYMTEKMRYFCMGNALVVPMVSRMANTLTTIFENED